MTIKVNALLCKYSREETRVSKKADVNYHYNYNFRNKINWLALAWNYLNPINRAWLNHIWFYHQLVVMD